MGSVESWAHACELLKEYIHRSHCGEKCTPTLIANKNPPTKRPHANDWLGQANAEWKKQKAETAHSKAVAESERNATDLVQEIATLRAENKTLHDELTKHKAAAVRRLQPIDPNNADGFDYEREDPGTDDDDGAECPATTSAVVPQRATPPKTKAWWQLIRIGQVFTYNKAKCRVQSVAETLSDPSVTVEMLAGSSQGTSVSVLKWWDLVDIGQKFWHRRRGKQCEVIHIDHGHGTPEPSLSVRFDDGSVADTEFTSLEPSESADEIQSKHATMLRKRKSRTFKRVIRDPLNGMLPWLQYHAQGSSRRAALIVEALVNALPEFQMAYEP
jgi:hypothetical protein